MMGEPDHVDLSGLSHTARAEVIDLVARLRARGDVVPGAEDVAWLAAGMADAAAALAALEADTPPEQIAAWLRALDEGATPIRWDAECGEFVEAVG